VNGSPSLFSPRTSHRHRHPPLTITKVEYTARVREVVFQPPGDLGKEEYPRLYFGNRKARAPHHGFATDLPKEWDSGLVRAELQESPSENRPYRPPPGPWTKRWVWLLPLLLGGASLDLATSRAWATVPVWPPPRN
jgi:hypothetical protein